MLVRLFTALIWFLFAASAVAWGLRLRHMEVPGNEAAVSQDTTAALNTTALSALLGATLSAAGTGSAAEIPDSAGRYKLVGVIAPVMGSASGVALISIDNQPAHPVIVGAKVDGDLVLQDLAARSVHIAHADGSNRIALELPAPPATDPSAPVNAQPATPSGPIPATAPTTPATKGVAVPPISRQQPAPLAQPSVRMANPSEIVAPGRRQRLHGHLDTTLPDKNM